jgi:hypothetical protein
MFCFRISFIFLFEGVPGPPARASDRIGGREGKGREDDDDSDDDVEREAQSGRFLIV